MNFPSVIEGWGKSEFWGVSNFGKFVYEQINRKIFIKRGIRDIIFYIDRLSYLMS